MTATFAAPDITPKPVDEQLIVNGRYRILDNGKPKLRTRATTFAKTIADAYHLELWKQRNLACGLVLRHDLYAAVASSMPADIGDQTKEERSRLNDLCKQAQNAAGSEKGSNFGTALHAFTDAVDSGRQAVIPPPWDRDIAAYQQALRLHGIGIRPEWIEKVVVVPQHDVAGKFDRIVSYTPRPRPVIADVKTAKSLDLGWLEIAIQLGLYANAETIYDPATGTHTPMPEVDREVALVMHLPVGKGECVIYEVDIAAGWEAAQLVADVRAWRKRKDLAQQINAITKAPELSGLDRLASLVENTPTRPDTEPAHISVPLGHVLDNAIAAADPFAGLPDSNGHPMPDRVAKRGWLLERREALITMDGGREALAAHWPVVNGTPVPTLIASDGHSLAELELITKALDAAEAQVHALFPERPDPTDPAHILVAGNDARITAIVERGKALPADLEQQVFAKAREAKLPKFDSGRFTEAHLARLTKIVTAAETEAAPRAVRIDGMLTVAAEHDATEAILCAALGVPNTRHVHGPLLEALDDLVDTLAHPDHPLFVDHGALVVDRPAVILAAYGNDRRRVWSAGREVAKRLGLDGPKDSDAVLSNVLLAAAVFIAATADTPNTTNQTRNDPS